MSALMILMATRASPVSGTEQGPGGRAPRRPAPRRRSAGRPALLDVVQRRLGVLLTGDPGGHLLPEGARADGAGHLVGAVEDPLGRLVLDLREVLRRLARVAADLDVLARGQVPGGLLRHGGLELRAGQVLDDLLGRVVL